MLTRHFPDSLRSSGKKVSPWVLLLIGFSDMKIPGQSGTYCQCVFGERKIISVAGYAFNQWRPGVYAILVYWMKMELSDCH